VDSRTTNAICISLRPREVVALERYLHERKRYTDNPLFLGIVLADLSKSVLIDMNRLHLKLFLKIQSAMKTDHFAWKVENQQPLDLVEFASELTALSTSSVVIAQLWESQNRIVNFLTKELEILNSKKFSFASMQGMAVLSQRLKYINQVLEAERQQNKSNKDVAQAQVQMV
jgi:alpha-amylase/alpha-mannosidase (GH57 family)